MDDVETAYYLRMTVEDKAGVLAAIAGILSEAGISIDAMQQKEPGDADDYVPLVMLTHNVHEAAMNAAIAKIEGLDAVRGSVTRIRVEQLS